jgi:hypothetical protein
MSNSNQKLELRQFDLRKIKDDVVMCMIGRRRSGKSVLIKDIMWYKRHFPIGAVISGTEVANKFFSHIIPKQFIHYEYKSEIIQNILIRQDSILRQMRRDKKSKGHTDIDPKTFFIMDDCLFDNKWVRDKYIRGLFMNGRHYKILYMLTMQYCLGIPPALRGNIDYVFIFQDNSVQNRRKLYENFGGAVPSFELFELIMEKCTKNHECLVIDMAASSSKIEDNIFWFKAKMRDDYHVGLPHLWKSNQYDSDEEEQEDFDYSKIKPKKKLPLDIRKRY